MGGGTFRRRLRQSCWHALRLLWRGLGAGLFAHRCLAALSTLVSPCLRAARTALHVWHGEHAQATAWLVLVHAPVVFPKGLPAAVGVHPCSNTCGCGPCASYHGRNVSHPCPTRTCRAAQAH